MVFCNFVLGNIVCVYHYRHNPYFNRWFSAISDSIIVYDTDILVTILILIDGFLQYDIESFNGIFHAVTILILIDGFLQFCSAICIASSSPRHNPYFNRWFSAILILD